MRNESAKRSVAMVCVIALMVPGLVPTTAHAGVITTREVLDEQRTAYERQELQALVEDERIQNRLAAMGVDPDQLHDRIGAMTDQELAKVNDAIERLPAGGGHGVVGGILGVLLLVFIVFVITDVIGATDIFPFIQPVDRDNPDE